MQRNRGDPHQLGVEETEPLVRGVAWPEARTRNSQSTGREHGVSFKTAPLCGGGHFLEAVLFKRISRLGISKTVTLKRFFVCVCVYIYIQTTNGTSSTEKTKHKWRCVTLFENDIEAFFVGENLHSRKLTVLALKKEKGGWEAYFPLGRPTHYTTTGRISLSRRSWAL